jgi:predicted nucleic acid-binding protein
MIGVDTGFFFALREGHSLALQVFQDSDIAVSVLTQFELRRISFRRGISWEIFGRHFAQAVTIVDVTGEIADDGARISHGFGIPALDALILASLVGTGCRTIYTRDEHFLRFIRKDIQIVRLD